MKRILTLILVWLSLSDGTINADIFTGSGSRYARQSSRPAGSGVSLHGVFPVSELEFSSEVANRMYFRKTTTWHHQVAQSGLTSASDGLSQGLVTTVRAEASTPAPVNDAVTVLAFSNSLIQSTYSKSSKTGARSFAGSNAVSIHAVLVSVDDASFGLRHTDTPASLSQPIVRFATQTNRLAPTNFQFPDSER